MKVIISIILGFGCTFGGFMGAWKLYKQPNIQVLAEKIEASTSPAVLATATSSQTATPDPTSTPNQTVTSTPTSMPTSPPSHTPKPTKKPTTVPSPSVVPSVLATPLISSTPPPSHTPGPTPDVWSPPSMDPLFTRYANDYGVDKNALERIANCESHFNPNAKNGDYLGMFQFSTSTWKTYRTMLGLDSNPALRTNIEESIKTAAFMMSKRGVAPWPACL